MIEHGEMLTDEYRYRILKLLEGNPSASQRSIARELGISLGRVNFCLNALIERGLVKVNNFHESENKRAYLYLLTPRGLREKAQVTARFLQIKLGEYEALKHEIAQLQREALIPDLSSSADSGHNREEQSSK
jgi:EPS-associated MarR family transcriptional regulator